MKKRERESASKGWNKNQSAADVGREVAEIKLMMILNEGELGLTVRDS